MVTINGDLMVNNGEFHGMFMGFTDKIYKYIPALNDPPVN